MIQKFLKKTTFIGIAGILSLGAGMYVHAETIGDAPIKIPPMQIMQKNSPLALAPLRINLENQIQDDHENALKNRDERNELLEEKNSGNPSTAELSDATDATSSASTSIADELSISLSNLENIEWRIDVRAADAAEQGDDVSTVITPLNQADAEITIASTSLATSSIDDARISTTTSALVSAEGFLGQALDALKTIVGN